MSGSCDLASILIPFPGRVLSSCKVVEFFPSFVPTSEAIGVTGTGGILQGGRCPDKIRNLYFNRPRTQRRGRSLVCFLPARQRRGDRSLCPHRRRIRRRFKFHRSSVSGPKLPIVGEGVARCPSVRLAQAAFVAIDRFLHPATLLAALVVTGYVKSSELNATADDGSRSEKPFGWFLNRHDLAATYSAIVIASVWDSLAIDGSASKSSDDLASLDHAQPAHGAPGQIPSGYR